MSRARLLQTLSAASRGTILRRVSTPVPLADLRTPAFRQLTDRLVKTLAASPGGVGLAAPQVNIAQRIFLAQLDDEYPHDEEAEEDAASEDASPNATTTSRSTLTRLFSSSAASSSTVRRRSFFSRPSPQPSLIINPILHSASHSRQRYGLEGCLSLPGLLGSVRRPYEIDVEYIDAEGRKHRRTLAGFRARIFQHELDHLDGKLYIDHIDEQSRIFTVR
jgi:peptide deformylase